MYSFDVDRNISIGQQQEEQYRIRRCPVPPPLSSPPPCNFGKILVVDNFVEKKIILKILELEITSKKIFLIFLFTMYDTAIILLLFWKKFLISLLFIKLSMKLARAISFSSSFFIWLFKINRIYIIIRICFFISKLNINWFFLFFIVFL